MLGEEIRTTYVASIFYEALGEVDGLFELRSDLSLTILFPATTSSGTIQCDLSKRSAKIDSRLFDNNDGNGIDVAKSWAISFVEGSPDK